MQGITKYHFDLGGVIINLDNQLTETLFVSMGAKPFGSISGMVMPLPFSGTTK